MDINTKQAFSDILPIIEKYAPSIGGALGGPVGAAAGYVLPLLAGVFGGHAKDLSSIVKAISADSSAPDKLMQLEEAHGSVIGTLMNNLNALSKAEINIKLEWAID